MHSICCRVMSNTHADHKIKQIWTSYIPPKHTISWMHQHLSNKITLPIPCWMILALIHIICSSIHWTLQVGMQLLLFVTQKWLQTSSKGAGWNPKAVTQRQGKICPMKVLQVDMPQSVKQHRTQYLASPTRITIHLTACVLQCAEHPT